MNIFIFIVHLECHFGIFFKYSWFVLTGSPFPFLLLVIRPISLICPKILYIDKHIRHHYDFEGIIHKKGDLLNEKKFKKPKANIRNQNIGKPCDIEKQCKIHKRQLKSAVINHSNYTLLSLNCRHKMAVYNILFQEG